MEVKLAAMISCSKVPVALHSKIAVTLPGSDHLRVGSSGASKWGSGFKSLVIQCARIGGVEIPNKKRIETSLQYVHGVGQTTARQILLKVGLENKITSEVSEPELAKIREELAGYMIEGELRRFNAMNIKRLIDIKCYRGRRHVLGLPCRGQHTQCNSRTRRSGKRRAVAGKKKTSKR